MPSQERFNLAKTTDLLVIADHYEMSISKRSMLKDEIKNILILFLAAETLFDSSAMSHSLVTQTDLQMRELEMKRQVEMEEIKNTRKE